MSVLSGREACRLHLLTDLFLFGSPTTVLYRADLVRARSPFYELGRLHEDTEVCFELLRDADFGFVHQVLSYRSVDPESISGREKDLLSSELDRLIILTMFGTDHLTPTELTRRHAELSSIYQRRLGQRVLRGIATGTMRGLVDYQSARVVIGWFRAVADRHSPRGRRGSRMRRCGSGCDRSHLEVEAATCVADSLG